MLLGADTLHGFDQVATTALVKSTFSYNPSFPHIVYS